MADFVRGFQFVMQTDICWGGSCGVLGIRSYACFGSGEVIWTIVVNVLVTTATFWGWWIFTEAQDRRYRNRCGESTGIGKHETPTPHLRRP